MVKINAHDLMFTNEDIEAAESPYVRLIRTIFVTLGITNGDYLERYLRSFRPTSPEGANKEFARRAAQDRKFMLDNTSMTEELFQKIMTAMGYHIEESGGGKSSISVTLTDVKTGSKLTFLVPK